MNAFSNVVSSLIGGVLRLSPEQRARFGRFAAVSLGSIVTGHVMLYVLHVPMGVEPVTANVVSTVANTTIVFVANRAWVWGTTQRVDLRREVLPFVALAALGLLCSSVLVWIVVRTIGEGLWVNAANLAAFGGVWVIRYLVLDRFVYAALVEGGDTDRERLVASEII